MSIRATSLSEILTVASGASWDLLPSRSDSQRAVPKNAVARSQGEAFSAALNEALIRHGVPGDVQTDGVISVFHIELLGDLMLAPGVARAFSSGVSQQAIDLSTDRDARNFFLAAVIEEDGLPQLTGSIKQSLGLPSVTGPRPAKKSMVVPLLVGGGILGGLLLLRARRG